MCSEPLPLIFKKTILLENMKSQVREELMMLPSVLDLDYESFCIKACLIDDSLFRVERRASKPAHTPPRNPSRVGALQGSEPPR